MLPCCSFAAFVASTVTITSAIEGVAAVAIGSRIDAFFLLNRLRWLPRVASGGSDAAQAALWRQLWRGSVEALARGLGQSLRAPGACCGVLLSVGMWLHRHVSHECPTVVRKIFCTVLWLRPCVSHARICISERVRSRGYAGHVCA